jgi:hypothetical protein
VGGESAAAGADYTGAANQVNEVHGSLRVEEGVGWGRGSCFGERCSV